MYFPADRIGFMQGRLSTMVDGKIQAFPWNTWREEFAIARNLRISLMEWTIDQEHLYQNPLMTKIGRAEIRTLCEMYDIQISSVTGDCFMQAPFWKAHGIERIELEGDFIAIAKSCCQTGVTIIVVPLVDNGRVDNQDQEDSLVGFFKTHENFFSLNQIKIAFESDYSPEELGRFIRRLNPLVYGINYDIGNSAALGFDPKSEFIEYGNRIINVHIKDRKFEGVSVPLGDGDANFGVVFSELSRIGYGGNYILQTARAKGEDHAEVLAIYRDKALSWLEDYAS
jgi:hexulose-6-phosphate isomerase